MGKELIDFYEAHCYDRPDYHPALARGVLCCAKVGECEFIDFKEEFHKCKAELIHDILCLANARSEYDRYILYGMRETEVAALAKLSEYDANIGNYVKGVTDEDFATKQATITQILDGCGLNKNLSNYVHLHEFELEDRLSLIQDTSGKYISKQKRILVLHIENVPQKPFFLTKDYICKQNCKKHGTQDRKEQGKQDCEKRITKENGKKKANQKQFVPVLFIHDIVMVTYL